MDEINKSGETAHEISTDLTDAESVNATFEKIKTELLPELGLATTVFDEKKKFVRKPFLNLSEKEYLAGHEVDGYDEYFFN